MSFSALKWLRVPKPSHVGQAPKGLLNENRRGSSSATARSHCGQECLAKKFNKLFPHSSTIKWLNPHPNAVRFRSFRQYGYQNACSNYEDDLPLQWYVFLFVEFRRWVNVHDFAIHSGAYKTLDLLLKQMHIFAFTLTNYWREEH